MVGIENYRKNRKWLFANRAVLIIKRFALLFIVLQCFGTPVKSYALSPEQEGYEISRQAYEKQRNFIDEYAMTTLELIDSNGRKVVRKTINLTIEKDNSYDLSIIQFLNPPDVRGTTLLTHQNPVGDDSQWLYLPEIKRVKRISSSNKSGAFVGSEFSYEDITGNTLEKWSYKKIGESSLQGIICHIVEKYPKYKNSGYSAAKTWISKNGQLLIRSELVDKKSRLLKVQTFVDWKRYKDTWRPSQIIMENVQNKKKSILTFENRKFSTGLTEKDFNKSAMKKLLF